MKSIIYFLLLTSSLFFAQTNSDCLDCHSDNDLTYERNGKEISIFTSESKLKNSAHGKLQCISCHKGFDAEDIPHKEGNNIYKVDCANCHKDIVNQNKEDIHSRLKQKNGIKIPDCLSCHNSHEVKKISQIADES